MEVEHFTSATHAPNPWQREHQRDDKRRSLSEFYQFLHLRTFWVTHTCLNPTCALSGVIADTAVPTLRLTLPNPQH